MNLNWKLCQLLIFMLASFIHEGISIKCWECSAAFDPKCNDPFDNSTMLLVDCKYQQLGHLPGVKSTMCRKIRQRVNGEIRISRHCAFLGESDIVRDGQLGLSTTASPDSSTTSQPTTASSNRISIEYFTCDHRDGCNGI